MYTLKEFTNDEQSYKLYRPISWYRTKGEQLGFRFVSGDFDRAVANGGRLGQRRYLPSGNASTSLPFPLGSLVECYLQDNEPVKHEETVSQLAFSDV